MNDRLIQAKIQQAEAKIKTCKIARDEAPRGIIVDLTEPSPLTSAGRRAGWGEGTASAPWAAKVR